MKMFAFQEQPQVYEHKVLMESQDPNTKQWSVTIDVPLQRLGAINNNVRVYDVDLMRPIINNQIAERISKNHLVGEWGHPISDYIQAMSEEMSIKRIVEINPKAISHAFDKIWLDGDLVRGHVRTLIGTEYGRAMTSVILDDKLNVGFSLRSLGGVEVKNGVSHVSPNGFRFVTYDAVFNPSNEDAIMERKDIILTESSGITLNESVQYGQQICVDNMCTLMESNTIDNSIKSEMLREAFTTSIKSALR